MREFIGKTGTQDPDNSTHTIERHIAIPQEPFDAKEN
jgi:hypothetical protein